MAEGSQDPWQRRRDKKDFFETGEPFHGKGPFSENDRLLGGQGVRTKRCWKQRAIRLKEDNSQATWVPPGSKRLAYGKAIFVPFYNWVWVRLDEPLLKEEKIFRQVISETPAFIFQ